MIDRLLIFIRANPRRTVALTDLEKLVGGETSYEEFAVFINQLVDRGVLRPVVSHGHNHKAIPLANTFRISKSKLLGDVHQAIASHQFIFHPHIKLDAYYALPSQAWEEDLPFIKRISDFLQQHGLPAHGATASEISYALVGDEKWIDDKGGKKVLERLGLLQMLNIVSFPDPLMLAVNRVALNQEPCYHLVVENKSPFYALLDTLSDTCFLSLIYGAGWKITADITMLERQLDLQDVEHCVYYFGDLDYEGVSIWHALQSRRAAPLAVPFYRALLAKPISYGKENQLCNQEALDEFLTYFAPKERKQIVEVLGSGGYLPQEALDKSELIQIWRNVSWESN